MEPFSAKSVLLSLQSDCQLKITSFTTDRSSTIKTMMLGDPCLRGIRHEYDPWHMIKVSEHFYSIFIKISFAIYLGNTLSKDQ